MIKALGKFLLIVLVLVILAGSILFVFADKIAAFSVDHLTEYRLSYDKWGNPFDRSQVEGMLVEVKDKGIGLHAKEANFHLQLNELLTKRELVVYCEFKEVSPVVLGKTQPTETGSDILAIPFSAGQVYGDVDFTLTFTGDTLRISSFRAISKDVRVTGDYVLFMKKDNISVDIKISFSPELSAQIDEDLRKNILSPDEGGWYSTVINYKGNPLLLKALYSITM